MLNGGGIFLYHHIRLSLTATMNEKLIILCPVYNDEEAVNRLLAEFHERVAQIPYQVSVVIVNDGSKFPPSIQPRQGFQIKLIHLRRNIGHQKALAIGLSYIHKEMECDRILILDADGQDRPDDAIRLLNESSKDPEQIVFAYRNSRQENTRFLFFYWLYKLFFRILTGRSISFGNFMVMPRQSLDKIVFYSEIWSHLAGGIIKSGLRYTSLPTDRAARYVGKSSMSFTSLVVHGLGSISVFMEVVAGRLLIFSFLLSAFSAIAIIVLLAIRTMTDLAIPGWTSTLITSMVIVLLLGFMLSFFTLFLFYSSDSQRKFVPAYHYEEFVGTIETT
jgi:glycosyltransferase involved in cell wall biosynthesis